MTPWLGALLLVLALRSLVKRWALFRPPVTEPGESGGAEPALGELRPLCDLPAPWAPLGYGLCGLGVLALCDLSTIAAWGLVLVACAWSYFLRSRARVRSSSSLLAPRELPSDDEAAAAKRLRIASVRASGRLDVLWFYGLAILLPSLVLLVRARTWRGALFSLACVLIPLSLISLCARRARASLAGGTLTLAILLGLWWGVPRSDPGAVESRFLSGRLATWTPAALVPEEDQFQLGSFFLPLIDAHADWEQSVRIRAAFGSIYDRAGQDPDLAGLPSVLGATYRDMAGLDLPHHAYLYVPQGLSPKSGHPVLLFFHGSLGSFQGYLAALRPLAEREGFAIVAPSYGSGLWRRKASRTRIEKALDLIATDPRLDAQRVVAVGLSAGGSAVSRVGESFPERVRGLAFLSPMIEPALFAEPWRGRPALVVHGTSDRRIPARFVERAVADLRAAAVEVRYVPVEGQDHFLYFADTDAVDAALGPWLREVILPGRAIPNSPR
jgi:pimeloyl-ACP methyl ester carboxylesterase